MEQINDLLIEPPREVWVVSSQEGPDFVSIDKKTAMDTASEMAGDTPELGPYRVCAYAPKAFTEHDPASLQDRLAAIAEANGFYSANHLAKAEDELAELQSAPYDSHEMADVVLAIMLHAEQHGVDLLSACEEKLLIVAARKYGSSDKRGVVRHLSSNDQAKGVADGGTPADSPA